ARDGGLGVGDRRGRRDGAHAGVALGALDDALGARRAAAAALAGAELVQAAVLAGDRRAAAGREVEIAAGVGDAGGRLRDRAEIADGNVASVERALHRGRPAERGEHLHLHRLRFVRERGGFLIADLAGRRVRLLAAVGLLRFLLRRLIRRLVRRLIALVVRRRG